MNRRSFLNTSITGTAAGAAMAQGVATADHHKSSSHPNRIHVDYEWGTLKEVVCGIPNLRIPDDLPDAVYNYAPTEGIAMMEANLGKPLKEADPELYHAAAEQMDATVAILEERGVKVHRLNEVTDEENAYLSGIFPPSIVQFFPRDPMLVIGNHFIETELFLPVRRRERFGLRACRGRAVSPTVMPRWFRCRLPCRLPNRRMEVGVRALSLRGRCLRPREGHLRRRHRKRLKLRRGSVAGAISGR